MLPPLQNPRSATDVMYMYSIVFYPAAVHAQSRVKQSVLSVCLSFCLSICLSVFLSVCLSVCQSSKNVEIRPMRRVYGFKEHLNKRFISLPMCRFRLHGSFSIVPAVSKIAKFSPPTNYVQIRMECTGDLLNYREHACVHGIAVPPDIYGQYNVVMLGNFGQGVTRDISDVYPCNSLKIQPITF